LIEKATARSEDELTELDRLKAEEPMRVSNDF